MVNVIKNFMVEVKSIHDRYLVWFLVAFAIFWFTHGTNLRSLFWSCGSRLVIYKYFINYNKLNNK